MHNIISHWNIIVASKWINVQKIGLSAVSDRLCKGATEQLEEILKRDAIGPDLIIVYWGHRATFTTEPESGVVASNQNHLEGEGGESGETLIGQQYQPSRRICFNDFHDNHWNNPKRNNNESLWHHYRIPELRRFHSKEWSKQEWPGQS